MNKYERTTRNFEQRDLKVLNFIKENDQETLGAEETVSDEHGSCVMELMESLEQLETEEESESHSTTGTDTKRSLINRLHYLEQKKEVFIESKGWRQELKLGGAKN